MYMTMKDIMGYLRVKSPKTVRRWISEGSFPKPRVFGGLHRWPIEDVARWASSRGQGVSNEPTEMDAWTKSNSSQRH